MTLSTEGRQKELRLIRILLIERFGPIPAPIDAKISEMTAPEIEELARRLFRASSIEELL